MPKEKTKKFINNHIVAFSAFLVGLALLALFKISLLGIFGSIIASISALWLASRRSEEEAFPEKA